MALKVKMLKTVPGEDQDYEEGKEYTFANDGLAKKYVEKGYASEVKGADGASELDSMAESVTKMVAKSFADGVAAGKAAIDASSKGKGKGPVAPKGLHQGEYTSADVDLDGHAIFGSNGGFLHQVKDWSGGSPSEDAAKKMHDWSDMQRKAGMAIEAKGPGAPSGNYEASDPDGGAFVIPEFAQSIYERMQLEENFLAEADNTVIRGNTLTIPGLQDDSRKDGSRFGGVQGVWANEAENLSTVSKPKARTMDMRLKKLYIFSYITDELLADSSYALEQYVTRYAAKELAFKTNDGMIRGTGAGTPLGILNSTGLITVSAEGGQATQTIYLQNIENMWMRLNYYYRKNAVWLINQDCEKQLQLMSFPVGIAGVPIYQPQGGVANPAYSTLKGRPVKIVEFCSTLGTAGDIILTNWEGYKTITKGGIKSDVSMHVRFLFGEMAYRFTFRMDGQPLWDKPLTPYQGTTTTSTMVALASR